MCLGISCIITRFRKEPYFISGNNSHEEIKTEFKLKDRYGINMSILPVEFHLNGDFLNPDHWNFKIDMDNYFLPGWFTEEKNEYETECRKFLVSELLKVKETKKYDGSLNLTKMKVKSLPDSVGGYLDLSGYTFPEGFKLPESVGSSLDLSGCTFPEGFKLPDSVGGYLDLSGCTFPEGFKLPDSVGSSIDLSGCTFPEGFKLPDSIGSSLYLRGCKFPEGFKLPDSVGGYLELRGCKFPEGFKLPDSVGSSIDLSGCKFPEGFKLPESVGSSLYLSGCTLTKNLKNKLEKQFKGKLIF